MLYLRFPAWNHLSLRDLIVALNAQANAEDLPFTEAKPMNGNNSLKRLLVVVAAALKLGLAAHVDAKAL